MANITECDGCGTRIGSGPGERAPGIEGNSRGRTGVVSGVFHWCQGCAQIACKAVHEARPEDAQAEAAKIQDMMAEAMEHPGRVITR
jgi:hypothetical protein